MPCPPPIPTEPEIVQEATVSQIVVKCPKCSEGHNPGIFRCTKCHTCLRPTFLGVLTVLGPIYLFLGVFVLLSNVVIAFAEKDPHFDVVSSVRFFMYAAGIVALNGLRAGLSSAWKAIQVIWAILIAFSAGLEGLAIFSGFSMTAFQAAIFILLGLYLHTKKVKAFCSVGRPAACDSVSNRDDIAAAVPSPSPPTEPDQASQDKLAVAVEHEVSVVMNRSAWRPAKASPTSTASSPEANSPARATPKASTGTSGSKRHS